MVAFRDPVGTTQTAQGAHGDAFDRVSAFQDGFDKGAKLCADMSVDNREFTARAFQDPQRRGQGRQLEPGRDRHLRAEGHQRVPADPGHQTRLAVAHPQDPDGDQHAGLHQGRPGARRRSARTRARSTWKAPASSPRSTRRSATGPPAPSWPAATAWPCWRRSRNRCPARKRSGRRCAWPGRTAATCSAVRPGPPISRCPQATSTRPCRSCSGTTTRARDVDGKAPATGFERVSDFRTGAVGGFTACKL